MHTVIAIVFELLLILGGVLALSALIVAQKPDAAKYVDKLAPYQALIGTLMLILGIVFFLITGPAAAFSSVKADPLPAVANLLGIIVAVLLGFLFTLPQIVGLGGPGSQQRAHEIAQKILPFQLLLGLIATACGVVGLLYTFGIMKYAKAIGI